MGGETRFRAVVVVNTVDGAKVGFGSSLHFRNCVGALILILLFMNTGAEMWENGWMTLFVLELAVGMQFVALTREDHHPGFKCRPSCLGDAGEVILPMLAYAGNVGRLEVW